MISDKIEAGGVPHVEMAESQSLSAAQKVIESILTKGSELMQEHYLDGKKVPHVSKTITDTVYKAVDMPKDNCVVVDWEDGLSEDDEPVSARWLVFNTLETMLCNTL